jgi:hypothetical protein
MDEENPWTLHPISHAINSSKSGSVSSTYNMRRIKNYSADSNYIYLIKGSCGFTGTNPRAIECEVTIPGGVDAEDVVAFRQLRKYFPHYKFDPNNAIFISINFIRRYPDLLDYIFDRYLEPNEERPIKEDILAHIPGMLEHEIVCDVSDLSAIQRILVNIINQNSADMPEAHLDRAQELAAAIRRTKDIDQIWYLLENQYAIFSGNFCFDQGTTSISYMKSIYTSDKNANLSNGAAYLSLIEILFSHLPRVNPLNFPENLQTLQEGMEKKQ